MPLDLSISDAIIGNYFRGQQLRSHIDTQRANTQLRQQQLDEQVRQFSEGLKQKQAEFTALQGIRQGQFNLAQAVAKQQLQKFQLETGIGDKTTTNVQGDQVVSTTDPTLGQVSTNLGQARRHRLTLGDEKAITEGKVAGARAEATLPFQLKQDRERALNQQLLNAEQNMAADRRQKSQQEFLRGEAVLNRRQQQNLIHLRGNYTLLASKQGYSEDIANYADDVVNLRTTLQEIPATVRGKVNTTIRKMPGFVAPPKTLSNDIQNFKRIEEVFRTAADIIPLLSADKTKARFITGPLAVTGKTDVAKKMDEMYSRAGAVVRGKIFADEKGNLAIKEVDRALNAFGTPSNTKSEGVSKLINVQRAVRTAYDQLTVSLPKKQKDFYWDQMPDILKNPINKEASLKAGRIVWDSDEDDE